MSDDVSYFVRRNAHPRSNPPPYDPELARLFTPMPNMDVGAYELINPINLQGEYATLNPIPEIQYTELRPIIIAEPLAKVLYMTDEHDDPRFAIGDPRISATGTIGSFRDNLANVRVGQKFQLKLVELMKAALENPED